MTKYLQCKECTRIFVFSESRQKAYRERKWSDPIRCKSFQEKAHEHRWNPYWGWESTMGSSTSIKKRHHRVNYPVHIVGRFR